jgi:hypothetical protein
MKNNPYQTYPNEAFWSRAVSRNYEPRDLIRTRIPLIRCLDNVISAGSCFASNLVPFLEKSGLKYLKTEVRHPAFAEVAAENFGYDSFSAAYGNIYTVRQLLQLLRRAFGRFNPAETYWASDEGFVDPYRPGLKHRARSVVEF